MEEKIQDNNRLESTNLFKEWLEELKQESWHIELVISGIFLFLIAESRSYIEELDIYAQLYANEELPIFDWVTYFVKGSWYIFMLNLLIHIFARGLWIGSIGLRYVTGEVNFKIFFYAEVFENYLEKKVGGFDDYIRRLERFCSIIYAYTFLLFFIFLSLVSYFGFLFIVYKIMITLNGEGDAKNMSTLMGFFVAAYLIFGLIYAIDFILLGSIKKIKERSISKIYFVIYWFFDILTLSFLYRNLVYSFIFNQYAKKYLWISLPYFFIIFILVPKSEIIGLGFFPTKSHCSYCTNEDLVDWQFYDDLRTEYLEKNPKTKRVESVIEVSSLESYQVDKNYTSLFLRMYPDDENYIEKLKKVKPKFKSGLFLLFQDRKFKDSVRISIENYFDSLKLTEMKNKKEISDPFIKEALQQKIDSSSVFKSDSLNSYLAKMERTRLHSFIDMTGIKIDGIDYHDSLVCKWFTHPNLGERGALCHFPVSSLSNGMHILELDRKRYWKRKEKEIVKDTFYIDNYKFPFFVIKK